MSGTCCEEKILANIARSSNSRVVSEHLCKQIQNRIVLLNVFKQILRWNNKVWTSMINSRAKICSRKISNKLRKINHAKTGTVCLNRHNIQGSKWNVSNAIILRYHWKHLLYSWMSFSCVQKWHNYLQLYAIKPYILRTSRIYAIVKVSYTTVPSNKLK